MVAARVARALDRAAARTISRFSYVASYTSANLPTVYMFTAFWGGQSGSLLFWALILSRLLGDRRLDEPHAQSRADAVRHRHALAPFSLFFLDDALPRLESVRASRLDSAGRHAG